MEVRAEGLLPGVHRQLSERERECVGGVVHDDVEPAELLHGAIDERVDGVDVTHMCGDADRIATKRPQVRFGFGARFGLAAGDGDLGPSRGEALGDGQPDPARCLR